MYKLSLDHITIVLTVLVFGSDLNPSKKVFRPTRTFAQNIALLCFVIHEQYVEWGIKINLSS